MFSRRTQWDLAPDAFAAAVEQRRASGAALLDLTLSNPTLCGFDSPTAALQALLHPELARYEAAPFGLLSARQAIAGYYREHGVSLPVDRLCLTSSTSEAYSFLLRLLCDPGDQVLAGHPSYPLLDYIAALDDVVLCHYPLHYDPNADSSAKGPSDRGWYLDLEALSASITPRTRALLVVHPNNPTGHFVSASEAASLQQLCAERSLALIVDEVFLDYQLYGPAASTFAGDAPCLTFVLSGLSKVCALPQMKLSWIAAGGPAELVEAALARLEIIADTFLSVNAPVQLALPAWLEQRRSFQQPILDRLRQNLSSLDLRLAGSSSHRLALQAGWTVILRVPRTVEGQPFAFAALHRGVVVQPGEFYGLGAGRVVLSLLTPPEVWTAGLKRLPL